MATAAASVLFQIGTGQNVMKPRVRHTPNLKTTTIIKSSTESYDRANDVKRFDDSKVGVKGLVDSGITTIPRFFVHPPETLADLKPGTRTGSGPEIIPAIEPIWVGLGDTIQLRMGPKLADREEIPEICRNEVIEWDQEIKQLGELLTGLLCEGLGVETARFKDMTCLEGRVMVGHYYPYCPQPDLTIGLAYHTDPGVLTVVQQDHVGGLQIISNEEYKSAEHRVLANAHGEPRVSLAVFFSPGNREDMYGPLPELISPEKPAIYRQFTLTDFMTRFFNKELDCKSLTNYYKL
uniref:Isopenicillin N synthase-like Fe(2+) 2OG dioxygenase domain-containing protein n=1 Tax=Fagus sylvatica TaxID=28930 RepID=A0A2N9G2Z0_FAGSY